MKWYLKTHHEVSTAKESGVGHGHERENRGGINKDHNRLSLVSTVDNTRNSEQTNLTRQY